MPPQTPSSQCQRDLHDIFLPPTSGFAHRELGQLKGEDEGQDPPPPRPRPASA